MDDLKPPPKVFANHVIRQMVDHMFGETLVTEKADFMVIRTAFRSLGGAWGAISLGSLPHLELLKQVVTTWGQTPGRKNTTQEVV